MPSTKEIEKYGKKALKEKIKDSAKEEFPGKIPIRSEVIIIPPDLPKSINIGWTVQENIGIGAFNSRAISGVFIEPTDLNNWPDKFKKIIEKTDYDKR